MFFLLSGVVLLRGYLRKGRSMETMVYMKRRVERLWPPYLFAWLIAGIVIFLLGLYPTWWVEGSNLPEFSMTSWFAQLGIIYFGDSSFNFAWWSLTVEIVFYLLVPIVIWGKRLLYMFNDKGDLVLFFISILIGFSWNFMDTKFLPDIVAYLFQYGVSFMGGIVLAKRDLSQKYSLIATFIGLVVLLFAFANPEINIQAAWGLFYFGLVAWIIQTPDTWLSSWYMVWLGERSYSLFLTHYTIFAVASYVASLISPGKDMLYFMLSRGLGIPAAFLVAMFVFSFIEKRYARGLITADNFWPIKR